MTTEEAKLLLPKDINQVAQTWADLGCGNGTFTYALAELLCTGSKIIAIDQSSQYIKQEHNDIPIEFRKENIENDMKNLPDLDGIIIANVFHFIKQKTNLVEKWKHHLSENGQWIIVEYEHHQSNVYEPYPLPFDDLKSLFHKAGYSVIKKTGERKSRYGGKMYSAFISKLEQP